MTEVKKNNEYLTKDQLQAFLYYGYVPQRKKVDVLGLLNRYNIKAKQEKVVIFTKYRKMQAILQSVIYDYFNVYPAIINGTIKYNRLDIIDKFSIKEGFNVIILSPKAAGIGLNITAANNVIHYSREWNPAVENQATDRTYRIGQEKDVHVYYPIIRSNKGITVEEKLDSLLEEKRELMKEMIVPTSSLNCKDKDFDDIWG